jgi:hypothetical protein
MNNIIAFGGFRDTGKDVSSNMLVYMLNTPKFMHSYTMYKLFGSIIKGSWKKTSFAKPLKQVLSVIFNVPVEKFEDREFKERCCVNLNTLEIKSIYDINNFTFDLITDNQFSRALKNKDYDFIKSKWITIRQSLQYVGTECARQFISNDIWINATLRNPGKIVISDLRFKREFDIISERGGILIYIDRPDRYAGNHASEREVLELYNSGMFKYVIHNNGTLKDLFYKIKNEISRTIWQ